VTAREEEELEQNLEAAQADEEENEHSKEWLNIFIHKAKESVALKLTTEEGKESEHSEEWLNIFSQEDEKTATGEFPAEKEEADSICFADLWEQIESLEERVKLQGVHIQQVKLETDEEGMGDPENLPMCQKFLQLRRLHEQSQPLEQMDAVIEEIRRLMLGSAETASEERLSRREAAAVAVRKKHQQNGADEQLQRMIWDPGGFQHQRWEAHEQELMNFVAEEFDAGASLHISQPTSQPCRACAFKAEERGATSFKFELNVIKCLSW
jgi:hypothetical protein